jgi:hypothetical protein
MATWSRRKVDEVLLISFACGATIEGAASKANVSAATAKRRLLEEGFQRRLREIKDDMVKRAAAMLTAASMEAVKTLTQLLDRESPAAVRLGAARAILELGVRLRESAELHERIVQLEQHVQGTPALAAPPPTAA